MAATTQPQPDQLDWAKVDDWDRLNEAMSKQTASLTEMLQILFDNQTEPTAEADDPFLVTQVFS